jgi:predicted amidophosphoribosyltransferase
MFVYAGMGKHICKECKEEEDEQFNLVKEYIYDNPQSTVMEVSKETGVRVTRIKMFLKEGRLIIPDESPIFLNCEVCGTNIKFGRICRPCADNLGNELKNSIKVTEYEVGEKPTTAKMRFANRYNN